MLRLLFIFSLIGCGYLAAACDVVVSIPPVRYIVNRIAANSLEVQVLVPPGMSPHSYEPSAKEALALAEAKVWFQVGECFERRTSEIFPEGMKRVNLLAILNRPITSHDDTHIWMSVELVRRQGRLIASSLSELFTDKKELFANNLAHFEKDLDQLEKELAEITSQALCRTLLVVHPAYGYFCDTYNFKQLAIENDGKEPSPKYLQRLVAAARQARVRHIFISPEYSTKEALVLARELNVDLVTIDPYSEDIFATLREMAVQFSA